MLDSTPVSPTPKSKLLLWILIFLLGAWIRSIDLDRPADGRVREAWRECDYAAVARNFHQEGMNILQPRIDWRGNGPGFAEMEFPLLPWLTAVSYRMFGVHPEAGRVIAWLFSLAALLIFFFLAARLLSPDAALIAGLAFALAPLPVRVSNALQPEGPMLFFYILAVWAFLRWLDRDSPGRFALAVFATAAVILVKLPAAHLGFLLLFLLVSQRGVKALAEARAWLFGFLALLPGVLWYGYAHSLWKTYGNSLGLSNETHWLGMDLLIHPQRLLSLLVSLFRLETLYVWMPLGALAAVWILLQKKRSTAVTVALFWLAAVGLYYILAIRTTGDEWSVYYHVVAAPAAALLLGAAAAAVYERWPQRQTVHRIFLRTAFPAAVLIAVRGPLRLDYPSFSLLIAAIAVFTAALTFTVLFSSRKKGEPLFSFNKLIVWALVPAVVSTLLFSAFRIGIDLHPTRFQGKYDCAVQFAPLISGDPLLLVSGGVSRDNTDRPVAYNAPYFFYWLDKKGFNIPKDRLSLESVQDFAARGAGFFILEKEAAGQAPGFLESLQSVYTLTAECGEAYLFDLRRK